MLTLDSLTVHYGAHTALRDVSLSVQPGEVLAVVGPNGAGKTTLIRAASGAMAPARGRVTIDGHDLHRWPPEVRARRVAVVPQAVRLPEAFTAFDTVLMGRTPYLGWLGRETEADRAAARKAMDRTCALELAPRRLGELSGGEQQRVLIARALAQNAPLLLMDEPTAHLDLRHQAAILNLVHGLAQDEGLAVVMALHDLNLVAQYADRVALLAEGELRALGTPVEVITSAHLSPAYGVPVSVVPHPVHGTPLVLPDGRS
jgi:iron complex transport system ATP-binding protein